MLMFLQPVAGSQDTAERWHVKWCELLLNTVDRLSWNVFISARVVPEDTILDQHAGPVDWTDQKKPHSRVSVGPLGTQPTTYFVLPVDLPLFSSDISHISICLLTFLPVGLTAVSLTVHQSTWLVIFYNFVIVNKCPVQNQSNKPSPAKLILLTSLIYLIPLYYRALFMSKDYFKHVGEPHQCTEWPVL